LTHRFATYGHSNIIRFAASLLPERGYFLNQGIKVEDFLLLTRGFNEKSKTSARVGAAILLPGGKLRIRAVSTVSILLNVLNCSLNNGNELLERCRIIGEELILLLIVIIY